MFKELIAFIKREGDLSFWKNIIWISMLTGATSAGLIAVVNKAGDTATNGNLNFRLFAIYIVLFLIYYTTKQYSLKKASAEIEHLIDKTKKRISNKIAKSELRTMEWLQPSTLLTRLSRDTAVISQSSFQFTSASQAGIMLVFSMIYILTISRVVFFALIISSVVVVYSYFLYLKQYNTALRTLNMSEEQSLGSFTSILNGFKELKINAQKNRDLLEHHNSNLDKLFSLKLKNSKATTTLILYGDIFLYTLLGLVVFIAPHLSKMEDSTLIKLTAITIFIIGPFSTIVNAIPIVSKTNVAVKSLDDLEKTLDKELQSEERIEENIESFSTFQQLSLKQVEFEYKNKANETMFTIGPIDLSVKKGEILFIVGGNGSGKSTLIKVLLGLYFPTNGGITVDDELIESYNYQSYRNLFSIILTDFHLFNRLYGVKNPNRREVNKLLIEMELNKKTKFIDGSFTNTDLSTGQRKRLALIMAILEDKSIYVFDEWAADQDPEFRKYFYEVILIRLKEQGKTVIAVTHDDAYFHVADNVYKMNYGQLSPYQTTQGENPPCTSL